MTHSRRTQIRRNNLGTAALMFVLALGVTATARAQTVTTLYSFTGHADGGNPTAGLTMDQAGNFYGTTSFGFSGHGTVFKLEHKGSGWVLVPLYAFTGPDGSTPQARVIFGRDGSLYGTTTYGGPANGGEVFRLQPPATACKAALCPWTETVVYAFTGGPDGASPETGDLTFDQAGNIYGTASRGGDPVCGCGVVYELSPSNGGWTETVLHTFLQNGDGQLPYAGVLFDRAGNIYGTTVTGGFGGNGCQYCGEGTIYELTPSQGGWTETILYNFTGGKDGLSPDGGLISDASGNLYGATAAGTVYELLPSNGGWTFKLLYSFNNAYEGTFATLTMDPVGSLYGTLVSASQDVFRLTPAGGQWILTGFNYAGSGDDAPNGSVILDASGNVYTTTYYGGKYEEGSIFEITP